MARTVVVGDDEHVAVCVVACAMVVNDGLYGLVEAVEVRLGSGVWVRRVLRLDRARAFVCETS